MRFVKGKWVKYSNKIFPRYEKKHYIVRVSGLRSVSFYIFEHAQIFQELINMRRRRVRK